MKKMILFSLIIALSSVVFAQSNTAYLSFDGSNDYVKYTDDVALGLMDGATDYTIEAWIYPIDGTVAEYDRVLQRYYSFQITMYDGNNDGKVEDWYGAVYDAGASSWSYFNTEGDATLTLDAWNHIAIINNSSDGSLKLYVNGVDVTQAGGYSNLSLQASVANDNLYIGQKGNAASYYGGYIDELRLKNVAVAPANLHFSTTDAPYTSDVNTAGLFHFDENSGTVSVNEASGTDATLNNGVAWGSDISGLPLPVELVSFTASKTDAGVLLNWETATEVNNHGFEIESSMDGDNWSIIGFVDGHGNSNTPQSYSFMATDGGIYFRLKQIDADGSSEYSNVVSVATDLSYKLEQNYPNPFNPATKINFTIPELANVSITIYNALGQKVVELANGEFSAGNHSVNFNASNLTSGIYFYRLTSSNYSKTMKMLLMK